METQLQSNVKPAGRPAAVSPHACRVWRGGEAIPAAVMAAFVVGVPLRLLLPVDTRYALVVIALVAMSATGVSSRSGAVRRYTRPLDEKGRL